MKKRITGFEDLEVYQKLCQLHLDVHDVSFKFPEFELSEIGSCLRKSSNSAPASIAEGYSIKHFPHCIECINRALGEIRETKHHLTIALKKKYIEQSTCSDILYQYDECVRLLKALQKTINFRNSKQNNFTKYQYPDNRY